MNTAENDPKRFLGETGQQNFPRASSPDMLNNSNILVGLESLTMLISYTALLIKPVSLLG